MTYKIKKICFDKENKTFVILGEDNEPIVTIDANEQIAKALCKVLLDYYDTEELILCKKVN